LRGSVWQAPYNQTSALKKRDEIKGAIREQAKFPSKDAVQGIALRARLHECLPHGVQNALVPDGRDANQV
jgi:hypothetical protein